MNQVDTRADGLQPMAHTGRTPAEVWRSIKRERDEKYKQMQERMYKR